MTFSRIDVNQDKSLRTPRLTVLEHLIHSCFVKEFVDFFVAFVFVLYLILFQICLVSLNFFPFYTGLIMSLIVTENDIQHLKKVGPISPGNCSLKGSIFKLFVIRQNMKHSISNLFITFGKNFAVVNLKEIFSIISWEPNIERPS